MNSASRYAIEVKNLCKHFKLYAHPRQILGEFFLGKNVPSFTALDDISFTVSPGEVVGIMGRNGAGKSTLLRIITGTLNASSGAALTNGRVSAILELGTGFNLDYTGRENIFAGGVCMGMSRAEIMAKMDEIIDFSELRRFIDQPFKTYSSGMQARLTFATAVAIEPEILIVDEALSVGDARFQAKCYAKIQQFRDRGGAILLVSHSDNVIIQFCDRAILLDHGKMITDDLPGKVTTAYTDLLYGGGGEKKPPADAVLVAGTGQHDTPAEDFPVSDSGCMAETVTDSELKERALRYLGNPAFTPLDPSSKLGNASQAEILDTRILDASGEKVVTLEPGKKYCISAITLFYSAPPKYNMGIRIKCLTGLTVFGANCLPLEYQSLEFPPVKRGSLVDLRCTLDANIVNGKYIVAATVGDDDIIFDGYADAIFIDVLYDNTIFSDSIAQLNCKFSAIQFK